MRPSPSFVTETVPQFCHRNGCRLHTHGERFTSRAGALPAGRSVSGVRGGGVRIRGYGRCNLKGSKRGDKEHRSTTASGKLQGARNGNPSSSHERTSKRRCGRFTPECGAPIYSYGQQHARDSECDTKVQLWVRISTAGTL